VLVVLELPVLDVPVLDVLVVPVLVVPVLVVPVVVVEACEAVALWLASTATVPVPTPAIAMRPMVAIATRRLPSSLVLTASPLVTGVCRLRRSFEPNPVEELCPSRALPRPLKRPHALHTSRSKAFHAHR
jgi:hypothetical protein